MKTYTVRFGWWMPVTAEYPVTMPDDATPDQIVEAAHRLAEQDGWGAQEDAYNGISDTFVDEISGPGSPPERVPIPEKWDEATVTDKHFIGPHIINALQAAKEALEEGHQNCGGGDDNIYAEPLKKVSAVLASVCPTPEPVEVA